MDKRNWLGGSVKMLSCRFLGVLLVVCLISIPGGLLAQEHESKNLLVNGDFEEGEIGKVPPGWGVWSRHEKIIEPTLKLDNKVTFAGEKALRMDNTKDIRDETNKKLHSSVRSKVIPMEPGCTYRFSFWAKADRQGVLMSMGMASHSPPAPYWVKIERSVALSEEWEKYSVVVKVPGEGDSHYHPERKTIYARINMETQGIIWVDNASLVEVDPEKEAERIAQEAKKKAIAKYLRDFTSHPPFATAFRTDIPPTIDGKLDDPAWQKAKKQTDWAKSVPTGTWFSAAYDETNLYLAVECQEPSMEKVSPCSCAERDGSAWEDNSVEFFVNPDDTDKHYFQFIVNMDNMQLDASWDKFSDRRWDAEWHSAIRKGKNSWSLEVSLPFSSIERRAPDVEVWRFNFRRNRFLHPGIKEVADWSGVKGNRDWAKYGFLVFGELSEISRNIPSRFASAEGEFVPLMEKIQKKQLEKFEKGDEAKQYVEALKKKEEDIRRQIASLEKLSVSEIKTLYASVCTLVSKYQELDKFVASLLPLRKYVKPIQVKGEKTTWKAVEFSSGEGVTKYVHRDEECLYYQGPRIHRHWFEYDLDVAETGTYILRAEVASNLQPMFMFLDKMKLTNSAFRYKSWPKLEWRDEGALFLTKGKHVLRFERTKLDVPVLHAFELIREKGLTPQQTLSASLVQGFNPLLNYPPKYHFGLSSWAEIFCLPEDLVRLKVSCINETRKPTRAKIALYSVSEKKDIEIYDVKIPGGESWPSFYVTLCLPDNIQGHFRFAIPQGERNLSLHEPTIEVVPLDTKSRPVVAKKLELELIDEIDCTKEPDDRHPYAEYNLHKTRVVDGPAGRYRLSGPYFGGGYGQQNSPPNASSFAYRLNFKKEDLGKPHFIVADIPDDAMRTFAIFYIERSTPYSPPSPGIGTGGQYPLSNRMVPLKFVCWPREKDPILMFVNWLDGAGAACSRIRVYRIRSGFPRLDLVSHKGRLLGHYIEEPPKIGTYYGSFDPRSVELECKNMYLEMQKHASPLAELTAIRNYFEYRKYIGGNTVMLPACAYGEQFYPSAILYYGPIARLNDMMRMYMKIAEFYDINIIAEIAPTSGLRGSGRGGYPRLDRQYTLSSSCPVCLVKNDGTVNKGVPYNPIHPEVQQFSCDVVQEFMDLYGDEPALKGISLRVIFPLHTLFSFAGGLSYGYGDYASQLFQKETGINIPVDEKAPDRFTKRCNWLLANAREEWLNWRCEKMRDLYERLARIINKKRPDMKLYVNVCDPSPVFHPIQSLENQLDSGLPWRDSARSIGIDPLMYRNHETIVCNQPHRWGVERQISSGPGCGMRGAKVQFRNDINYLPEMFKCYEGERRALMLNTTYYENHTSGFWRRPGGYGGYPDFWGVDCIHTVCSNINPVGRNILARYTKSMALGDCQYIFEGGTGTSSMGYEEYIQEFARAFLPLPDVTFKPYPKQSEPVFLWQTKYKGEAYFYLANAAWYGCKVNLQVTKSGRGKLIDLSSGAAISAREEKKGKKIYRLSLKGFQLRSFSLPKEAEIVSIDTEVPEEEVIRLGRVEKEIEAIIEKASQAMNRSSVLELALDTFKAGKAALAEKRYFEAQRQFENYRLARIYQRFGYPESLKFVGPGQNYRKLLQ